jgi:CRP/FNR family transcriptional regulator, dissimilatory nitrate respiration regulator
MDYSILIKAPLFRGMMLEKIVSAISVIPYRIHRFNAGSLIAQSGEPINSFLMVIDGVVKGEMVDYTGRIIKIEEIPASGALASAFIFGSRNRFPVNVVAVSDAKLMIIEKADFLKFLKSNESILINFLDIISDRSQFLSEKIKFLSFKTIKGKLAQYILQTAGPEKLEIRFSMTQNELAEYFGVVRPSIARVISEMEDQGVIVTKGKYLKILDKKRLTELTIE